MAKKVFGLLEAMANAAQAVYIIGGSLTLMAVGLAVKFCFGW